MVQLVGPLWLLDPFLRMGPKKFNGYPTNEFHPKAWI